MDFKEFQKENRRKLMPSGDDLALMAQQTVNIDKNLIEKKFNFYLRELLTLEFELYKKYEKECSKKIIKEAITKKLLIECKTFDDSFYQNYELLWKFFLSISQSRKSRAGGSFEKHIKYLFEQLKYPFDTQTLLDGKVDYVIPSESAFKKNRTACVVISIKRTLRERWRQAVGELSSMNAGRIYILTADEDISQAKVDEMKKHNVNLVVWDEIKKANFEKNFYVMGFTQFIMIDLPSSKQFWQHLI